MKLMNISYAHNMQLQVHPHNHPLGDTTSTQNAVNHKNTRATVHVLGPPNIMLLTHIRFLNRLRSTASPILSHFHTLLHLTLSSSYSVWIQFLSDTQFSTKCLNLKFPLEHSVQIISSLLCDLSLYTYSCLVICTRTGSEPECSASSTIYST